MPPHLLLPTPNNTDLTSLINSEISRLSSSELPPSSPSPLSAQIAELTPAGKDAIAQLIDHTLLAPTATGEQLRRLVDEAVAMGAKSICVNGARLGLVVEYLTSHPSRDEDTPLPLPCVVVGFPLGNTTLETKLFETKQALDLGAKEIDMVPNAGYLKDKDYVSYLTEIQTIVTAARDFASLQERPEKEREEDDEEPEEEDDERIIVKVIIETSQLTRDEIIAASLLTGLGGADFVKTSTGFVGSGAKVEDVRVMREVIKGFGGKVKASGGVRDLDALREMVKAGAERIGTSSGVKILGGSVVTGY